MHTTLNYFGFGLLLILQTVGCGGHTTRDSQADPEVVPRDPSVESPPPPSRPTPTKTPPKRCPDGKFDPTPGKVLGIAYSADGKLMATASKADPPNIRLIRTSDGTLVRMLLGHEGGSGPVAFSPDGAILASGGHSPLIKLWNVSTGSLISTISVPCSYSGPRSIESLEFDESSGFLVSAGCGETVHVWDPADGSVKHAILHPKRANAAHFAGSGDVLTAADDGPRYWMTYELDSLSSSVSELPFSKATSRVLDIAQRGLIVITAHADASVKVWWERYPNCHGGPCGGVPNFTLEASRVEHRSPVNHVRWLNDAEFLTNDLGVIGRSDARVVLWLADDVLGLKCTWPVGELSYGLAASRDGKRFAAGGTDPRLGHGLWTWEL